MEKKFGLRAKLLAPILAIIFAALLVSATIIVRTAESVLVDANQEKIFSAALVVGNSVLEQLNRAQADISFASKVPDVASALDLQGRQLSPEDDARLKETNALLVRLASVGGYYETFYVTSDKGMTLTSNLADTVGKLDISNRPWFHETMASDRIVISEPFRSRLTGDALVAVASRFSHNGYSGAMVGSLQIRKVTQRALELKNTPSLKTVIVSNTGTTIASLDDSEISTRKYGDSAWFASILSQESGTTDITVDGVDKLVGFYRLPGTNFYALALANKDYLLAPALAVRGIGIISTFLAMVLACGIVYLVLTPVIRDIHRLVRYAVNVGKGQLDQQISVRRSDELGALSRSLDEMQQNLKKIISELEEATRARSDFLARMSHEIRTPMNAIIGMTYLAQQANPDEKQRNYLGKVERAAKNLLGIINDILDFSKIEAGKMTLMPASFRLSGMLQSVHDLIDGIARDKNIALNFSVADTVPDALEGDSLRISQICINICSNALKFTEQGSVSLHVAVQEDRGDEVLLHFSVQDTGIGIRKEQIEKVFDSFAQVDDSATRRYGGTGLGLPICKLLVQLMHGEIWAESTLGAGSTFHFTLLLRRSHDLDEKALELREKREETSTEGKRILLVEDNEINQEIASELLKAMGIDVSIANNGAEALEICKETVFDLVLMDIQMPIMDGLEATRRIRASGSVQAKEMPIIAMTANAMSGDREKSLQAGMNDHITKPIDHEELRAAIQHWCA